MTPPRPPTAPTRILVPLTFGGATEPKLQVVTAQARALEARVTLLHVLPNPDQVILGSENPPPPGDAADLPEAEATSFLQTVAAEMSRAGVNAESEVRYGPVVPTVCELAHDVDASLIVVGASESTGLSRMLAQAPRGGGLAGAISRASPRPVLVIPRGTA